MGIPKIRFGSSRIVRAENSFDPLRPILRPQPTATVDNAGPAIACRKMSNANPSYFAAALSRPVMSFVGRESCISLVALGRQVMSLVGRGRSVSHLDPETISGESIKRVSFAEDFQK